MRIAADLAAVFAVLGIAVGPTLWVLWTFDHHGAL